MEKVALQISWDRMDYSKNNARATGQPLTKTQLDPALPIIWTKDLSVKNKIKKTMTFSGQRKISFLFSLSVLLKHN